MTGASLLLTLVIQAPAPPDAEEILSRAGLLELEARAVEVTSDGALWAVGLGGVSLREDAGWTALPNPGGLEPRVVFRARPGAGPGETWLATSAGAARVDDEGGWSVVGQADGLPHAVVHDVAVDGEGIAWVACRRGLVRVRAGGVVDEVLFPDLNVRTAVVDGGGALWIGTSDGVRSRQGEGWVAGLEGRTVTVLLPVPGSGLWAGTASAGLFRWDGVAWRRVGVPGRLAGAEVFDLASGPDGALWLATSAGVARVPEAP